MRSVLLVGLFGCAGVSAAPVPAPVPPTPSLIPLGSPLVVPGESMVYEIKFRGLPVGRVAVAVGKPGWVQGRPAVIVKSRGQTDGIIALLGEIDWAMETTIDLETGNPLRLIETATVKVAGETEKIDRDTTDSTHTIHSACVALRGWRSISAQKASLELRIDAAHIELAVHEAAREYLASADKPAVRYDGIARAKYPFKFWLSDDTARVPLFLQTDSKWGAITVELVEYNAPRD